MMENLQLKMFFSSAYSMASQKLTNCGAIMKMVVIASLLRHT